MKPAAAAVASASNWEVFRRTLEQALGRLRGGSPRVFGAANGAAEATDAVEPTLAASGRAAPIAETLFRTRRDATADDRQRPPTETVAVASSLMASAGYVIWSQRSWSLLFTLVTASPLWSQFDPLAVLDTEKEKEEEEEEEQEGKRRGKTERPRGRRPRAKEGTENPLLPLIERSRRKRGNAFTQGRGPIT